MVGNKSKVSIKMLAERERFVTHNNPKRENREKKT